MRPSAAFLGHAFVDPDDARVHVTDRGYLVGDGVFVTMRARAGLCYRLSDHLDRLVRGCELFGLALPYPRARLALLADEAAVRSGAEDAYVRVTITRGDDGSPTLTILARALDAPTRAERQRGIRIGVVGPPRPPVACADPYVKTTSYAPQMLARRAATARGWDEGLQLSLDGTVACATTANVFAVFGGNRLVTPPLTTGCRAGVTRARVLALASALGLTVSEGAVSLATLRDAEEVFLTSTRIGCLGARALDDASLGTGTFTVTHALDAALEQEIAAEARP